MEDFKIIGEVNPTEPQEAVETQETQPVETTEEIQETSGQATETPTEQPAEVSETVTKWSALEERGYKSVEDVLADLEKPKYKDEFIEGLVNYYEKNGDLNQYLEVTNTNWDEVTSESIVRMELKAKYPDVSNEVFEAIYKKEVIEKYSLDPETNDEVDVQVGKAMLDNYAQEVRAQKKAEQEEWKSKQRPVDIQAEIEQWTNQVEEELTPFLADKRVVVEMEGAEPFNYDVDAEKVKAMSIDNNQFFALFKGEDGKLDWGKWVRAVNYAMNPKGFESALIKYGQNLGKESVIDDMSGKNPITEPTRAAVTTEPSSLLEAFARAAQKR